MCGLTGAVWSDARLAIDAETLARMTRAIEHRGPDDEGFFVDSQLIAHPGAPLGVALGHRRLSIIDTTGGHQPLANEDDSIWIAFNGEIYNYPELQRRLEGSGHRFRTHCDTEVLVHLYEDEGLDFLKHLNGMFAIALWDGRLRRLILARDRLGKKPLVYRLEPGRLLFASELKSLLEVPGVPRDIDPRALDEYLTFNYVPHPRTIFRGIAKLPPAHYGVFQDGRWSTGCYWNPDFNDEQPRPAEEYAEQLRELLTSSVRMRMQSDVPLGAFLSGGLDSSLVVALMQQASTTPVKTFSIGFPEREYDESGYAKQVAAVIGTEHHEFRVEPSALEVLPKLVWHYDEPFADSSAIPTYYVSQLTRQHVTVALTGDGGDELFVGYLRYHGARMAAAFDRLPRMLRAVLKAPPWTTVARRGRQKSLLQRAGRLAETLRLSPGRRYMEWIALFNERQRGELYSEDFIEQLPDVDPYRFLASALARSSHRDPVTAVSLADLVTYLPCDLMTKVDIASMASALECRQPFLDYRVVELAIRMPVGLKVRRMVGKRILREAFSGVLPQVAAKRSKMGFGVPLEHWFRGELKDLVRDALLDSRAQARGYFKPQAVERLIDEHQSHRANHAQRLWGLLFLELWHREWIDQAGAQTRSGSRHTAVGPA